MADIFYLAASFSNLEAAGRAYTLIERLLRRESDTDLSVYRFELSGLAFVVVLGLEAAPRVMNIIKEVLGQGTAASLPAEVLAFLAERRQQQSVRPGFVEGHYTRETAPRYQRRAQRLPVTWHNELPTRAQAAGTVTNLQTGAVTVIPPHFVGVCDWCTSELTLPVAAIHHFAVELTFPDGFRTVTEGVWATCSMCRDRLHLKEGDTHVRFGSVDNLWLAHGRRYLRGHFGEEAARGIKIRTYYNEEES